MFRKRLLSGGPLLGFYLHFPSPELTEFMGHMGFDYVFLDAEHFTFGIETVQHIARAAQLTGMQSLVRVPGCESAAILPYLEAGIGGVVVPGLLSAAEARAAVSAVKYHPLGARGAASTTRAADYGMAQSSTAYFAAANESTVVLGMVESKTGIANLPEILEVEGLDGMAVGKGDLALSMGFPGRTDQPQVARLADEAKRRIRASDKALGVMVTSLSGAEAALAEGAAYITLSLSAFLKRAGKEYLARVRELI